jgi:hypothetical protein
VQFVGLDAPKAESPKRTHVLNRHVARIGKEPGYRLDADPLAPNNGTLGIPFQQSMKNPDAPIVGQFVHPSQSPTVDS